MSSDFLTTKQAADVVGVSYQKFMGMLYRGRVKHSRHGWSYLITRDEADRLALEIAA